MKTLSKEITAYLISSEKYKSLNRKAYLRTLSDHEISKTFLEKNIIATHLEGLFYESTKDEDINKETFSLLCTHMSFRQEFNSQVLQTLKLIKESVGAGETIVILKGINLWFTIYKNKNHLRRINDIDLLIADAGVLKSYITKLHSLGLIA